MSITIPPEITWLFPIVVGESWPEGDEDKLRALGDAWRAGAVDIGEVIAQAKTAADQAMAGMDGKAADAFEQYWNQFVEGSEAYLTQLQEACEGLGDSCDNCALEVEYAKYSIIAALILLAIEIAAMIAAAFGTFGASTAGIPIAQAATRITVQMIFRQLIMAILKEVLIEVGIDVAIQGLQMAKGDRTSWDWSKTGNAALSGAISGAIGGGLDFVPTRATGLGGNIAEGAVRGGVEGVASTVATAAVTGQDITAGDLLRAGVSGGVGGSIGGAKTHFDTPDVSTPGSPNIPGTPGSPNSPGSPGSPGSPDGPPTPSPSPSPSSPGSHSPDGPGGPTPSTPSTRTPDSTTSASGFSPTPDGPGANTPSAGAPPRIPTGGPGDGGSQSTPGGYHTPGGQPGGAPGGSPGGSQPAGGGPRPGGPAPSSASGYSSPGSSSPGTSSPGSSSPGSGPNSSTPGSSTPGSSTPGGPSAASAPGGPAAGAPSAGGPTPGGPTPGGPTPGGPTPGGPSGGGPTPGGPTPGSPAGGPTPGGPTPGSPAGGPTPGGPTPGSPAGGPTPSGPTPGGPAPGGPTPGSPITGGPTPGAPTPGSLASGGYTPSGPTAGGPTPGGFGSPSAGGPAPGGFGPTGGNPPSAGGPPPNGFNSPGGDGHNQGGYAPMGGAPVGGTPGGGPGGRPGDGSNYSTDASTAAPAAAFADTGTYTDQRGGGAQPDQRGIPSQPQPNQGFAAPPPAAGGFGGGPQQGGGPAGRPEFGPGARPFGPGANPNQGFGPNPDALNRPQPGGPTRPDAGTQPGGPRPGAGTQPGGPTARPDGTQPGSPTHRADTQPGGPTTRPDGSQPGGPTNRTDTQPGGPTRPDGTQPGGPTNRTETQTGGPATRPDGSPKPDAGPRPDGTPARPDATATPDTRPDASGEPDVSRSPGDGTTPPGSTPSDSTPSDSTPSDSTPSDSTPPDRDPAINGEDSDGPTPDSPDSDTDSNSDTDTDAPPIAGDTDDGPRVDENDVPLNYLGNRQGEHKFADMGEYIPMGGDRSNGMGSYDQRVAPLISDHNPWGEHGTRDEFNAHHRPDGTFMSNKWPDNDGAVPGSERQVTLPPGTVLDRFGAESGRFLSPLDTDGQPYHYRDRAIFPDNAEVGYHVYVVDDPNGLPGTLADVAPALGQPGGGRQFTLPEDVRLAQLIADGTIREVHVPPADGRVLPESFGRDNGDGTQNTGTVSVDDAHNGIDTTDGHDRGDTGTGSAGTTPPLPDNLQQIADNSSFRTPAGGALFDQSDVRTRNAANAVAPIDGHFVLDVHSDGRHAIVDGQQLNGADLADLARHMGWNGTDPIILNGCEAGRGPDGLAADLARASGAQVIAPTERSWSGEQNTTPYSSSVDSVDDRGRARPAIPPDGGWRAFDPDGGMRDTGSNGLPVDTQPPVVPDSTPGDASGTPDDGPTPTPTQDSSEPLRFGDDVDRGRIQSPFTPPAVTDPDAPHTINVDNNAAAAANQNDPHRPLREGERLIGRAGLTPNSQYDVPGRGTYYTDGTGTITHADLEVSNTRDGIKTAGADQNPDASYPEPNTTYRVTVGGSEHTYTTDAAGLPPRYTEWNPPQSTGGTVNFPVPGLPPNDPRVRPPTRGDALSDRACWPPNSQIVHTTPHGTTTLHTGDADPNTGTARVVAIDTWSSPGNGANNNVLVNDLNPELNNLPPNTVTRINGQDVYVTNDHGVTFHATDERTYGHSAPRSQEAQDLIAALGSGTDGGHIRPTAADGAPDARNQFPQDSDENRPQKGQPSRETWYGQDREAGREQNRGTDHLWHDLETEGSHAANPAQPTAVHERWVMRDSSGRIRLHFRRYDN